MKKTLFCLFTFFACLNTNVVFGIGSELDSSVVIMEAVLDSLTTSLVVGQDEFVVSANIKSNNISTIGTFKYQVLTCSKINQHDKCKTLTKYIVTVVVTPPSGTGPVVPTVTNIKKVGSVNTPKDQFSSHSSRHSHH